MGPHSIAVAPDSSEMNLAISELMTSELMSHIPGLKCQAFPLHQFARRGELCACSDPKSSKKLIWTSETSAARKLCMMTLRRGLRDRNQPSMGLSHRHSVGRSTF